MRLMSIRLAGRASRKFIAGTRLCPPARIFPSPPCVARSSSAWSTVRGAKYLNETGFIDDKRWVGNIPGNQARRASRQIKRQAQRAYCDDRSTDGGIAPILSAEPDPAAHETQRASPAAHCSRRGFDELANHVIAMFALYSSTHRRQCAGAALRL